MFDRIAPRYDLFNDVLSARIHHRWRDRAIDTLGPRDGREYLDLCAGTLDFASSLSRRAPRATVVGVDFSLPMLHRGRSKVEKAQGPIRPVAADVLDLPFRNGRFAGCTIGFGLRNLTDFGAGLREMHRVLSSGGRLVVLEFTTPPNRLFRALYHGYFHHILPRAGAIISGDRAAARYLPDSVSQFPDASSLDTLMTGCGFAQVRHQLLTGGIASIHLGVKE